MQPFILINDDGTSFSCEPKLIKGFSEAEVNKLVSNSSIAGRCTESLLYLSPLKLQSVHHFNSSLPKETLQDSLRIFSLVENGKKVVFSKITQTFFSGNFVESGLNASKATINHYSSSSTSNSGSSVLYQTVLPWGAKTLSEKIGGLNVYFIAYTIFSTKKSYSDCGLDFATTDFYNCYSQNSITKAFSKSTDYLGAKPQLYLAMGIQGMPETFFPIMSNVFCDMKVCLGKYYLPNFYVSEATEEELFMYMLVSFLFSGFNADLIGVTQNVNAISIEKTKLLEKMYLWDKNTLEYSPEVTADEILCYAKDNPVRKFGLDSAKKALETFS